MKAFTFASWFKRLTDRKREREARAQLSKKRAVRPGRFDLESFEPRLLLSADPVTTSAAGVYTVAFAGTDDVVGIRLSSYATSANGGVIVDLTYLDNAAVLKTLTLGDANTGILGLVVDGGGGADRFTVDALTKPLTIHGGLGTDTLIGPNAATDWTISGANAGFATSIDAFDSVENLTGRSGDDRFKMLGGGSLSGEIKGGEGVDSLVGGDIANTWILGATRSLNGRPFSEIERLVGGNQDDNYQIDADSNLGTITIDDARGGVDTLDFSLTTSAGVTIDLSTDADQTVNGNLHLKLSSGESIENLIGTGLADTLTGNILNNLLVGGAGNDTLDGSVGDDFYTFGPGWGTDTVSKVSVPPVEVGPEPSDTVSVPQPGPKL